MITIILNKNIYPLDIILSASYSLTEKAYFLFDENKEENIVVDIAPKGGNEATIENEFREALLNCLNFKKQVDSTKEIRKMVLQRALLLGEDEKADGDCDGKEDSNKE